jgi:ABC-type multidrug transport system fused ATPase/permease subunit
VPILVAFSIWYHHASEKGYLLARDRIANVLADLSESLYGIRVVTANNRQRRNIRNHRHVVGAYRDANAYTGRVNAVYGPSTLMIGILGQAMLLGIGGHMVLQPPARRSAAHRLLPLPQPVLRADSTPGPAVHDAATGPLVDHSIARTPRDRPDRR